MPATRRFRLSLLALVSLAGGACGSSARSSDLAPVPPSSGSEVRGDITVFAAASLTDAYEDIGRAFHAAHPQVTVTFNFAASSRLAADIVGGADADVLASADQASMRKLTDAGGHVGSPKVFATNALQIIVAAGNPERITSVADLARPGLLVVTCASEVPIGTYTQEVLSKAAVTVRPVSLETDVKAIVTKVTLGEADAGIVYRTDVRAAGTRASGVDIPADVNVLAEYPIVVTKASKQATVADAFVDFVTGPHGRAILVDHGFSAP